MEILYEDGVISLVEQKQTKTGKTYWIYTLNKKKFSSFEDLELSVSDNVRMTYKINNGYNNAMGAILLTGEKPKVSYEDVKNTPVLEPVPQQQVNAFEDKHQTFEDKRRKEITLAQASNLALQFINSAPKDGYLPAEFDVEFKNQTKRFFKLMLELQQEAL